MDELHKAKENDDLILQAMVCNKIALRFKSSKQFFDAIYYYKRAMDLIQKMGAENTLLADIVKKNLSLIDF